MRAQSVCENSPYLGTGPIEEMCVLIQEGPGGNNERAYFRGPSPLYIDSTIGDYYVNDTVTFNSTTSGMSLSIQGIIRRTGQGNGNLIITADGGVYGPISITTADLVLEGNTSSTSKIQLGGAAGYAVGQDIGYSSFNHVIELLMNNAMAFDSSKLNLPLALDAVAIRNITTLHLNNVGDSIDIPSIAGIGGWRSGLPPPPPPPPPPLEECDNPLLCKCLIILLIIIIICLIWYFKKRKKKTRGHIKNDGKED
jgi:hypothetical protein